MRDGNFSVVFYPYTADSIYISEFFEEFSDSSVFNYESEEFSKLLVKNVEKSRKMLLVICGVKQHVVHQKHAVAV